VGDQHELTLLNAQPGAEHPYERVLGDALDGDGALLTREDSVGAAWAVVDAVLESHPRAHLYSPWVRLSPMS
jgi:glucose-6-phosphate 1-dehydrogenase